MTLQGGVICILLLVAIAAPMAGSTSTGKQKFYMNDYKSRYWGNCPYTEIIKAVPTCNNVQFTDGFGERD